MSTLALLGGQPVRTAPLPRWPVLGDAEVAAATAVIRGHDLCAQMGSQAQEFAADFARYCGVRFGVATSNGTTALHTALVAAGIGVGDEVIVPPYTFFSTATAVLMQNALPVFADIESQSLGLDPAAVELAITPRTRAVILVHMNGYPGDVDGVLAVARRHGLTLIEDGSHAHGAAYRGRLVGSLGALGAFSFQQKKNLSLGEGGMVTTDDPDLAARARAIHSFGKVPLAYNYRMTELHAAIGRVRLPRLDAENEVRSHHARRLDSSLAGLPGLHPQRVRAAGRGVYYNYVIDYRAEELGVSRQQFVAAVRAEGIPVPQIYAPVYRHHTFQVRDAYGRGFPFESSFYDGVPAAQRPRYEEGTCPVAEAHCDGRNIEVKVHPTYAAGDVDDLAAAFTKVVDRAADLREREVVG